MFDRGAFFDVDGTLVATNVVDAYAYYVFHRGTIFGTAQRLLRGLAMAPVYALSERVNRKVARVEQILATPPILSASPPEESR